MDDNKNKPGAGRASNWREAVAAALLLALALALAYGPAKLASHSLYSGVIQDLTNLYGFYAWDSFTRAEFLAGRFPLWNPHNAFGVPHLANMQTAPFFPLNLFKWAFGFWPVIDALLLLRLFLAGFFTWAFARQALKTSFWAAIAAGVAFMLSGYLTRFIYMSHLNVETLLPMQLWLLWRMSERPRWPTVLAAGAGFACLVLGGFPEATLYAVAFALAYHLAAGGWRPAGLARGAAALAIGLALSLPQWLPFAEYYPHVWTYHLADAGLRHYDVRHAITLLLPWFFGENRVSPVAVFLPPYVGAAVFALALLAVAGVRRAPRPQVFFAAALIVLLGLAFGLPPFSLLGRVFPFSLTYNDKYSGPAVALCFALLGGCGIDRAARGGRGGLWAAGAAMAWIVANVVAGFLNAFRPVWALGLLDPLLLAPTLMLLLALLALCWMRLRDRVSAPGLAAGAAAIILLGLLYDLQGQVPAWHDRLPEEAARRSQMALGASNPRMHAEPEMDEIFPNRLLPPGVDDIRYYDPLYPKTYVDFMAEVNGLAGDTLMRHYNENMLFVVDPSRRNDALLDLAGLSLLILPGPMEERPMAREWSQAAHTRSPRRESWLRAEETVAGGVSVPALTEHAPARVAIADESLEPSGTARAELRFAVAVPDNQLGGRQGDGVFFGLFRGGHLAFARYLDPKARPDEIGFRPYTITWGKGGIGIVLLPGPLNNTVRDAGAIGNPRVWEDKPDTHFTRLGEGLNGPWIYTRDSAFPRAWMTKTRTETPAGRTQLATAKSMLEANPLSLRQVFLSSWKGDPGYVPTGEVGSRNSIKLALRDPGRVEIGYQRVDTDGFVMLSDQRLPGWRAWVGAVSGVHEAAVAPADGPFLAVPVAKGVGSVSLWYQPWGFRIGLWVALGWLVCSAAVAVVNICGKRPGQCL